MSHDIEAATDERPVSQLLERLPEPLTEYGETGDQASLRDALWLSSWVTR